MSPWHCTLLGNLEDQTWLGRTLWLPMGGRSLPCPLNYCSAGPWAAAAGSTLLPPLSHSFVWGTSFPGFRAVRSFLFVLVVAYQPGVEKRRNLT